MTNSISGSLSSHRGSVDIHNNNDDFNLSKNFKISSIFIGTSSAIFSSCILQPLDVFKTRLQQKDSIIYKNNRISYIYKEIIYNDGISGFWRGLIPTILRITPAACIYFYTLDFLQSNHSSFRNFFFIQKNIENSNHISNFYYFNKNTNISQQNSLIDPSSSFTFNLISSGISRAAASLFLSPVTFIKTRIESSVPFYKMSINNSHDNIVTYRQRRMSYVILDTIKNDGLLSFYRGSLLTMFRDVSYSALYYALYIKLKHFNLSKDTFDTTNKNNDYRNFQISTLGIFSCSLLASTITCLVTQPLDVIRTRTQLYSEEDLKNKNYKIGYAFKCTSKIIKTEGFKTFFSGLIPRFMKKNLTSALTWTTFEELTKFFNARKLC